MIGHTALGAWSGGRFMHFGETIADERLEGLLAPGDGIDTVITADVYGAGEADTQLGRALAGRPRERMSVVGAVGHDFYTGERNGAKGFPRFTDPALRGADQYADYLRMATERSLERCGLDGFDLLLLHNPDRTGYTSETVWNGMAALRDAGLTRMIGVAPGPANGFTLDLIDCLERFGELVDWAMIILNPLEPWPGELCLDAAAAANVRVITRVVDYGGLFFDDLHPGQELAPGDHRGFRPAGWIESGRERLDAMRPIAQRAALTPIQLAVQQTVSSYKGDDPKFMKQLTDTKEIVEEEIEGLRRLVDTFRTLGQLPKVEKAPIALAELVEETVQSVESRGVDVGHRLGVEHQPPDRLRCAPNRLLNATHHVVRIREEQPVVEPVDNNAWCDHRIPVNRDVGIGAAVGTPAEHRVMGSSAPADDIDDRQADRHRQRLQHACQNDAGHRHRGDGELDPIRVRKRPPLRRLEQRCGGGDDDRAEHRLGQVRHGPGQEHQHERHRPCGDEPRNLRPGTHVVIDGGTRVARTDGKPLREPGGNGGCGHRKQLLIGPHVLAAAPRERAGGQDLVGGSHEEDPERCGNQLQNIDERRPRDPDRGQAGGDMADHGDTVAAEVKPP